jgi:hypothetical protein
MGYLHEPISHPGDDRRNRGTRRAYGQAQREGDKAIDERAQASPGCEFEDNVTSPAAGTHRTQSASSSSAVRYEIRSNFFSSRAARARVGGLWAVADFRAKHGITSHMFLIERMRSIRQG